MKPLTATATILLVSCWAWPLTAMDRPTMAACAVPDGTIVVDGRDDEWQRLGPALDNCTATSPPELVVTEIADARGLPAKPPEGGFTVHAAVDKQALYLLVDMHDPILINDGPLDHPWDGDDLEVFIDARAPESRFTDPRDPNDARQFIFVAPFVSATRPQALVVWQDKHPGVKMACRLRPWGYTMEILIPKALFPYWRDHPDMDSIGFDMFAAETDSAGSEVTVSHLGISAVRHLLSPGRHGMSAKELGVLTLNRVQATPASSSAPVVAPFDADRLRSRLRKTRCGGRTKDDEALAQAILDAMTGPDAGELAGLALASPSPVIRKTGAFVLARRPELPAPLPLLVAIAQPPAGEAAFTDAPLRAFALSALALRHELPAAAWFDRYLACGDRDLQLNFIGAAGLQGDRTLGPRFLSLLKDPNGCVVLLSTIALGRLREPAALEPLRAMLPQSRFHGSIAVIEHAMALIDEENASRK